MPVNIKELLSYNHQRLNVDRFRDYCPNGLQVEGKAKIEKLATGVTASMALIEQAIDWGADALLVHHGYFWKGENPTITGIKRDRLSALLTSNMNLLAYHLPLDAHPEVGNNAMLAKKLGITVTGGLQPDDPFSVGFVGELSQPQTIEEFSKHLEVVLARTPLAVGQGPERVKRIAWCTGGAQGYIDQAADLGVDLYLSGEISEQTTHIANERGLYYVAAGHHATERYGAEALGRELAEKFSLDHRHFEINNPA